MIVHLVRSPELPILDFESICDFIGTIEGEIQFNYTQEDTFEEVIHVEDDEYRIKRIGENFEPKNDIDNEPFFDKCDQYREQHEIPKDELVILLTKLRNDNNYFGYVNKGMNNVFIQTSNWGAILGEELDDQLPIVYEIAVWTLRHLLFKWRGQMITSINQKSIGCVMDMCKSKEEISLKMRTGDISPKVMRLISEKKVNPLYLKQLISIFEKIRTGILFRERCQILNNPSRLILKDINKKWRLVLVDFGDVILNFEYTQLTVYLLFLKHPEGLEMRDIEDYRNVIDETYRSVCPSKKSDENIEKTVLKLSSFENITYLNEVISRINTELKNKIPSSILNQYIIKGERGGVYSVGLNRNLISTNI